MQRKTAKQSTKKMNSVDALISWKLQTSIFKIAKK